MRNAANGQSRASWFVQSACKHNLQKERILWAENSSGVTSCAFSSLALLIAACIPMLLDEEVRLLGCTSEKCMKSPRRRGERGAHCSPRESLTTAADATAFRTLNDGFRSDAARRFSEEELVPSIVRISGSGCRVPRSLGHPRTQGCSKHFLRGAPPEADDTPRGLRVTISASAFSLSTAYIRRRASSSPAAASPLKLAPRRAGREQPSVIAGVLFMRWAQPIRRAPLREEPILRGAILRVHVVDVRLDDDSRIRAIFPARQCRPLRSQAAARAVRWDVAVAVARPLPLPSTFPGEGRTRREHRTSSALWV